MNASYDWLQRLRRLRSVAGRAARSAHRATPRRSKSLSRCARTSPTIVVGERGRGGAASRIRITLGHEGGCWHGDAARRRVRRAERRGGQRSIRSRRSDATLPGGLKIERRKIRGETFRTECCARRASSGSASDHEGILALDIDARPGTPFLDVMPVGDTRLVIDVLPNRPDLLSHEGLAREIAAATGGRAAARRSTPASAVCQRRAVDARRRPAAIDVTRRGFGAGRRVTGDRRSAASKVGPSPEWLVAAARSGRLRVDQQRRRRHELHAARLRPADARVRPREARRRTRSSFGARANGEKIVTLDGVERKLDDVDDRDRRRRNAAGNRGRHRREGTARSRTTTTDILLEAAAFDPEAHSRHATEARRLHRRELPLRARRRSLGDSRRSRSTLRR